MHWDTMERLGQEQVMPLKTWPTQGMRSDQYIFDINETGKCRNFTYSEVDDGTDSVCVRIHLNCSLVVDKVRSTFAVGINLLPYNSLISFAYFRPRITLQHFLVKRTLPFPSCYCVKIINRWMPRYCYKKKMNNSVGELMMTCNRWLPLLIILGDPFF